MTKCKLCQKEIEGIRMTCSKGSVCMRCEKDISLAEYQPIHSNSSVFWILAETFFRRGKGEDVSFEQLWNEGNNLKLITFEELFEGSPFTSNKPKGGETNE